MYGDLTDAVLQAVASDKPAASAAMGSAAAQQAKDSEVIARAKAKEKELLDLYEKSKIRADFTVSVPTNDVDVRQALRNIHEPISLFGEDAFERRQRLKLLLSRPKDSSKIVEKVQPEVVQKTVKTFYTHGTANLLATRKAIFQSSRACAEQRRSRTSAESTCSSWASPSIASHVAGSRPLSAVAMNESGQIALGSWSGEVTLFDQGNSHSLLGHTDRCSSIAWSPLDTNVRLASGGSDMKICLWSSEESLGTLEGHELRINRIAFHPRNNNLLFSTSDDETWRMWDIEKKEELLLQEGHVSAVFAVACHPDGSLLASSDTSGVIRVWDLRTGRSIMGFEGHMEQVVALDFSPNGTSLASGSGDNSVRIWDLRKKDSLAILTGHEKLVSAVKFDRMQGDLLLTASYDCVAKLWDARDMFKIVKNLPIHESRIMAADLAPDGKSVVTACYDRTFKIWSSQDKNNLKMEMYLVRVVF